MKFALESFDSGTLVDTKNSAEYEKGFAAGRAEALSDSLLLQRRQDDELLQVLSDTTFSFAEAQAHVLASLGPLIDLVMTRVLPASLLDGFGIILRDVILAAAGEDAKRPITLAVAPAQLDKLRELLEKADHPHLAITADPDLSTHAAFLSVAGTETVFDLDTVMSQLSEAFAALIPPKKRSKSIGK